ncbi:polyprenyl synthetase family protein [Pirellulaceae bacterium]|nr:polyprenyl synthetase family protein [Pirellulaceae bacterium]
MTTEEMEVVVRQILTDMELEEHFIGWTMVMFASEFWRDQVAAVPTSRRLFLLPHCLKHSEGCPADYDQFGLDCKTCGACSIADFRGLAEDLGYRVLVAEGSPIVLKIIVSGYVDAVVGVACLNVLEKAVDKILLAGIPCMAVPLLSDDCRNTSVDEQWVDEMIRLEYDNSTPHTCTYMHLMRASEALFAPDKLEKIIPRIRGSLRIDENSNAANLTAMDPIGATEAVAYDFLSKGGKHSRPFITLATYDALTGGRATQRDGDKTIAGWTNSIKRTAMSIETFHKASLVHDDIEDDDPFRYGEKTIHHRYGTPTAINIGDYLIGMGYRFVSTESATLGADVTADILDVLAEAHTRLSEGQGAELLWRDALDKRLKPIDALKIYALKTSPAFEAAMLSGIRMAQPIDEYRQPVKQFARNLGVAFQILNDLSDWQGDDFNKMEAGGDALGGRPTLLHALALETLSESDRTELLDLTAAGTHAPAERIQRIKSLYEKAGVFELADRLIDKHQARAEAVADDIQPEDLRRLMYFLIDSILERPEVSAPQVTTIPLVNNVAIEQEVATADTNND